MGVGQLSESDAVDALRLPFYSSSHPTGSHGWRNQFDLGNPDLVADTQQSSAHAAHFNSAVYTWDGWCERSRRLWASLSLQLALIAL